MNIELIVPTLGESITEATVSKWLKKVGEPFEADEPLVEIETDKITVEVPAPSSGSIFEIKVEEGSDVNIGGVLAVLEDSKKNNVKSTEKKLENKENIKKEVEDIKVKEENIILKNQESRQLNRLSPSVKKLIAD